MWEMSAHLAWKTRFATSPSENILSMANSHPSYSFPFSTHLRLEALTGYSQPILGFGGCVGYPHSIVLNGPHPCLSPNTIPYSRVADVLLKNLSLIPHPLLMQKKCVSGTVTTQRMVWDVPPFPSVGGEFWGIWSRVGIHPPWVSHTTS